VHKKLSIRNSPFTEDVMGVWVWTCVLAAWFTNWTLLNLNLAVHLAMDIAVVPLKFAYRHSSFVAAVLFVATSAKLMDAVLNGVPDWRFWFWLAVATFVAALVVILSPIFAIINGHRVSGRPVIGELKIHRGLHD
jgi:hypothetical protein